MAVYCGQYYQNIFSWANTNFNYQNRTFSFSAHVFIVKTRYALANIFSWAKYDIFMGKAQSFHGQTELRVITRLVGVVLSCSLHRKWVEREKAQYTSVD